MDMKTFNASDLAHKRTEIFNAAIIDGAILQRKNTNGEVLDEFVVMAAEDYTNLMKDVGEDVKHEFSLEY
jgi:hypothetical protein